MFGKGAFDEFNDGNTCGENERIDQVPPSAKRRLAAATIGFHNRVDA
jgi:hypothetical protein